MPSVSSSTSSSIQNAHSPDFTYKKPLSYRAFETFLKQDLKVADRRGISSKSFSLHQLMTTLGVKQAYLKGSTVLNWQQRQIHPDIDLQIKTGDGLKPSNLEDRLKEFVKEHVVPGNPAALKAATWFSKVSTDIQQSWNQSIVSLGYPNERHSKIDINFSTRENSAYDTLNASKTIYFDVDKRQATEADTWSPKLVEFFKSNNIIWFNPEIDNGLSRLSYRFSKNPHAFLIQPHIVTHFVKKADPRESAEVLIRILGQEYTSKIAESPRYVSVWEKILGHLDAMGSDAQATTVTQQLLVWSHFSESKEMIGALHKDHQRKETLKHLSNACRVDLDCRSAMISVLEKMPDLKTHLEILVHEGINLKQIEPDALLPLIHAWQHISQTPEAELLKVFGPYLEEQNSHPDSTIREKSGHMLGWLRDDPFNSAMFMLDRIPEKSQTSPPSRLSEPLVDFVIQTIRQCPKSVVACLMPRLLNINPGRERTIPLLKELVTRDIHVNELVDKALDVLRHNAGFSPVSTELTAGGSSFEHIATETKPLKNDLQTLSSLIGAGGSNVPPLLRGVVSKRNKTLTVDFNDLKTSWNSHNEILQFEYGQMCMSLSKNRVKTEFVNPATRERSIQIAWDSHLFIWGTVNAKTGDLNAKLYQATTPAEHWNDPLLDLPRSLCLAKWTDSNFSENSLHGECDFNLKDLNQANSLASLIQSIKSGVIMELSPDEAIHLEVMFDNQKPSACMARNQKAAVQAFLELKFTDSQLDHTESLTKTYGIRAVTNSIQSNYILTPWPARPEQVKISSAWNRADNRLEPFTAIHSLGENAYVWLGDTINHVHLLTGGEYRYAKDPNPMVLLAKGGENDFFPIEILSLVTNLKYTSTRGTYDFQPFVHCSSTRWPEEGFEGFINEVDCGDYKFSGYITSNGQAIGRLLVATPRLANGLSDILAGNFIVDRYFVPNPVAHKNSTLSRDQVIALPDGRHLRPHGLCQYYGVDSDNMSSIPRSKAVFFNGYGFLADSITRTPDRPYDAPNSTQHFKGVQFDNKNKPQQVDIVINPKDGSSDFLWVRPAHFSDQDPYQTQFTDSSGFEANLLMINGKPTIGTLNFPTGLTFKGKLEQTDDDYYGPMGQGSLTFDQYGLSGQFNHGSAVGEVSAKNSETDVLLGQISTDDEGTIALTAVIAKLTDGAISYDRDLRGKMRMRQVPNSSGNDVQYFNRRPGSRANQMPLIISPAMASQTASH